MNKKVTEIQKTKSNTVDKELRKLVINELLNSESLVTGRLIETLKAHAKDATLNNKAKAKIEDAIYDVLCGEFNQLRQQN